MASGTKNTRDRIIEAAIRLFNKQGTRAVTTNHIAAAADISPGNLYYHFRNKEDIIRAIFEQMDADGEQEYRRVISQCPPGSIEAMRRTFAMIQEFNWRYRFFKRELTGLILSDPLLHERFRHTQETMIAVIRDANAQAIAAGTLKPMTSKELDLFTETIWLMTLFWLNYLEIGGEKVNEATLKRGIELLQNVIQPHLAKAARSRGRTRNPTR